MPMKINYSELSKGKIAAKRNVVVSRCSKGGFTVAQQIEADENGKTTSLFMKGALHVDEIQGLYNLRDAISVAINRASEEGLESEMDLNSDEEDW